MGFWKNLWNEVKSTAKEVATEIKSAAKEAAKGVANAAKYVGEKLEDAGEWIDRKISNLGKKKNPPPFDTSFISSSSSSPGSTSSSNSSKANEEMEKRAREAENHAITVWQEGEDGKGGAKERAKAREIEVKKTYKDIYKPYFENFEEVLDSELMDEIKEYVNDTSRSFANTLRDEVNAKVNSSYQPWKQLLSSHPSPEQIIAYCDKVYADADNNLLDLLQTAIESTNKFIGERVSKYNEDKAKALAKMKESLVKLTSDEETKAQELKKIAEELTVAQFIAYEASIEI
jgi:hypothetical protein